LHSVIYHTPPPKQPAVSDDMRAIAIVEKPSLRIISSLEPSKNF